MSPTPLGGRGRNQPGPAANTNAGDPLARISNPEIQRAARRLAARTVGSETIPSEYEGDAVLEIASLAAELDALVSGREPGDPPPGAVRRRRLLDRLRAELIRDWASRPEVRRDEMLAILDALERLNESAEPERRPALGLAAGLGDVDERDLLVELVHDLRSPLTSILFLAETLRRGQSGEINDIQRRQLGIIYSAALGLISVAGDVIELARGGDRLAEAEPAPFSVAETFDSVRDTVQPLAEERGLTIRLLPPARDQRVGYPVALSRVLLNLTTNALKFTDEGFVEVVARECGPSRVEFSVRDTGNGIAPEVIGSLYEPFRRARTATGYAFSGSGLGLAICRRLVEAMGSTLQVETRAGWGTRFYFELDLPPFS